MGRCRWLLLILMSAACVTPRPSGIAPGPLIAIVEEADRLTVLREDASRWTVIAALPLQARAVRLSDDAREFAWLTDDLLHGVPGTRGHHGSVGSIVDVPIAVEAVLSRPRLWATNDFSVQRGCVVSRASAPAPPLCGEALQVVERNETGWLVRSNRGLVQQAGAREASLPLRDVFDARARRDDILIAHRVDEKGIVEDALSVWTPPVDVSEITRAAVIIDAEWDDDGTLLIVRKQTRKDVYELMLAHAPEEFGGEAISGEAVRVDARTRAEAPVIGLEGKLVRRLFRVRLREHP
jgi:hypothetical protein